ncbi:MAG: PDDEXK nuclease domain-containing protein [Bacteroidia bacterium]
MSEMEKEYSDMLHAAVAEIKTARANIARQVNAASISVYWNLGRLLSEKKIEKGHGAGVINRLSVDLKLEFLGLTQPVKEKELEQRLIDKIKQFVLELGRGFTFISNQHRLEYNEKEYFVDILLYHRGLRSLVALELKIGAFKPEYVGKMNFYLGLLDKLEKQPDENPSIGIILCADKDHLDVEIALQDVHKPIGVAEYKLLLPTKELEAMVLLELNKEDAGK